MFQRRKPLLSSLLITFVLSLASGCQAKPPAATSPRAEKPVAQAPDPVTVNVPVQANSEEFVPKVAEGFVVKE